MARRCGPTRWSWSRDGSKARLLIQTYPLKQKLSRVVEGKPWAASPDTRMMQLLHDTGVRLGLVTNGDQWMLVDAPKGETTGYASWYASLWLEEPITLQAFRTLLGSYRFFGVPEDETLERLLAQSAQDQQEVTDQLGYQVRQAVEVLIQSLDRADRDSGGTLLSGVPEDKLYEAALTVMMRLVFLFCAEERELLLLGDELYDKNYAVSTLREQLRVTADQLRRGSAGTPARCLEPAADDLPGGLRRHPARAAQAARLRGRTVRPRPVPVPGRPQRRDDLEGHARPAAAGRQPHRAAPARSPPGAPGAGAGRGTGQARKLSFRALRSSRSATSTRACSTTRRCKATEPVLGLNGPRDKEPEVALSKLEALAAKGEDELLEFLKEETGRSSSRARQEGSWRRSPTT